MNAPRISPKLRQQPHSTQDRSEADAWFMRFGHGWNAYRLPATLTALSLIAMSFASAVWAQAVQTTAGASVRPQLALNFSPQSTQCVAWSPDGATIATGTGFGAIRLWDARSGSIRRMLGKVDSIGDTINTLAFSPDGKLLASGDDYHEINIWNAQTGELMRALKREEGKVAHSNQVFCVAWSPDGKTLASGSLDKNAVLWDIQTGSRLYTLKGHTEAVTGVAFSPDGATLVSVGDDMKLWDTRTGTPKGGITLKGDGAQGWGAQDVAWSPDGKTLAIASSPLELWDVQTQKVQNEGKIPLLPPLGSANAVNFSPDSSLVATAHSSPGEDQPDCDILIWDAHTSELKQTLRGHKKAVARAVFSPDGKSLASVSLDGALKVWPLAGNRPPVSLLPLDTVNIGLPHWLAMTEEGFYNATDSPRMRKSLKWRVGKEELPVETFETTFRRPDIIERLLKPEPVAAGSELGLLLTARSAPPSVAFVASDTKEKIKGDSVNVEVVVSDEVAVRRLEFRVNGRPVKVAFSVGEPQEITEANRSQVLSGKAAPASHSIMVRYNTSIPLPPGESKILVRATARDASGLEGTSDVYIERELITARGMMLSTLSGAAAREAEKTFQGDLHVLSIGVSQYKNAAFNLQYPVADATSFAALWPPMKDRLYQKVTVTQLADSKATTPAIQSELDRLVKTASNKDTVLIFLAGHGLKVKDSEFYFATHESNFELPQKTALAWTSLTDVLSKVPAKRVVLFLDACHSGAALGVERASNERMAETLVKRAGVMVFASSRGDQASLESPEWKHGAFTKAVLEGIAEGKANLDSGAGKDGNITVAKLLVYLQARVPILTRDQQHPACPLMQDFGEPFKLAKMEIEP